MHKTFRLGGISQIMSVGVNNCKQEGTAFALFPTKKSFLFRRTHKTLHPKGLREYASVFNHINTRMTLAELEPRSARVSDAIKHVISVTLICILSYHDPSNPCLQLYKRSLRAVVQRNNRQSDARRLQDCWVPPFVDYILT